MKILIVGGGGREHALAWRLAQSKDKVEIVASPGNPGIAQIGKCIPAPQAVAAYAGLAREEKVHLTVVGPEAPLVAGIADVFRAERLTLIGPTQAAAQLEGSKIFAKRFFDRAGIPTARSVQADSREEARSKIKEFSFPVVVKADGLAAGKGVVIANTKNEAEQAIERLGPQLVIEEFLEGEEVSFIGLSDGKNVWPFAPTQDHKRALDGDEGPNTGGMGAYADERILSPSQTDQIMDRIMIPAIEGMRREGTPFTGFLYAGLMMTADGPKVLEFNVRLGDPETQALMYSYRGDLAQFLRAAVHGDVPPSVVRSQDCSVCVVLAAKGYPEHPKTGDRIEGISGAEAAGATVFHAGTKRSGDEVMTNGGRVLGVTAGGATLQGAIEKAYTAVAKIRFEGMHYRRDIGRKGLRRW